MREETIVRVRTGDTREEVDAIDIPEGFIGITAQFQGDYAPFEVELAGQLLQVMLRRTEQLAEEEKDIETAVTQFSPLNTVRCLGEMVFQVEKYLNESVEETGEEETSAPAE